MHGASALLRGEVCEVLAMVSGVDGTARLTSDLAPQGRERLGGFLLLAAGAILLLVSLFLDWFEPGFSAWTVFEVLDMVLAALALVAVAAAAGALGMARPIPERLVLGAAVAAPIVVIVALVNHPPGAQASGQDPMVGIWLALAGSLLMLAGVALAVARISVALQVARPTAAPAAPRDRVGRRSPDPVVPEATPPVAGEPPPGAPLQPGDPTTRRIVP